MKFPRLLHIFYASVCLAALTACHDYDGEPLPDNVRNYYINLNIAVVSSDDRSTRAGDPAGGEHGDGREAAFERENRISGITLILFRTNGGINATGNPTVQLARYFPVTRKSSQTSEDAGKTGTERYVESVYTTGNQLLGNDSWSNLSGTYSALVVANKDLSKSLTEGSSTLSNVRDMTETILNDADSKATYPHLVSNFVMSSEQDFIFDIDNTADVEVTTDASKDKFFDLKKPVLIERLAARLDFWADNSDGYDDTNYSQKGYVYKVKTSGGVVTDDRFVVTGFRTFNFDMHYIYRPEYVFKRVADSDASGKLSNISYLGNETDVNYVIDPYSEKRKSSDGYAYLDENSLYYLLNTRTTMDKMTLLGYRSVETLHNALYDGATAGYKSLDGGAEDIIIDYMQECTLLPNSLPYYYATGVALIGYYYTNGTGEGKPLVYCGFLRHQGEGGSYTMYPRTETTFESNKTMSSYGGPAMNFGVVRNNIYRLSISGMTQKDAPSLELEIKVKKWDPYTHEYIYM